MTDEIHYSDDSGEAGARLYRVTHFEVERGKHTDVETKRVSRWLTDREVTTRRQAGLKVEPISEPDPEPEPEPEPEPPTAKA